MSLDRSICPLPADVLPVGGKPHRVHGLLGRWSDVKLKDYDAAYRLAYCQYVKYGRPEDLQEMLRYVALWARNEPPSIGYLRAYGVPI
jgi:hypothetical protein